MGELHRLRNLHLFAGIGGGILADILLGHQTICAVEINEYRRKVLVQRQKEKFLEKFPIWDDVQTFDGKPWRGRTDIISGGFPCQDVSSAGKGLGVRAGKRSGLWKEFARIIGEIQPPFVFIENTPLLVSRGLDIVLTDLTNMGYNARWCVLGAWHIGGPHKRDRIWIFAYSRLPSNKRRGVESIKKESTKISCNSLISRDIHNPHFEGLEGNEAVKICSKVTQKVEIQVSNKTISTPCTFRSKKNWWDSESGLDRVADGISHRIQRITAIGDGQVPFCAAMAFLLLSDGIIPRN